MHESGLTGGSSAGDDSHITSGSIQISAGDGLASITIGGHSFTLAELQALSAGSPSAAISVEGGTLVLTGFTPGTSVGGVPTAGTLTYTYTLSGERTHSSAGNDDVQLNIALSVTDAGNVTASGSLTIEVIDDVPTVTADTASVGEGATLSVDAASGVLSNDVASADGWADSGAVVGVVAGATGSTSSGGVGGRIDGDYGYLTLNADGSYVYVSTANAITGDEVEVFTYTVRDGDGDLSSTTLSINVADVTLSPVNESDSVNESGLSGGSSEGDGSHSTTSQVAVPPGLEVVPGSGTTTHGTFTIDEDGNYTYTLTETTSGDATTDSFTYVTRDANGNTVTNTVTVDIVNDVPVAVDDANSIAEDAVSVTGNVIGGPSASAGDEVDTEGADGATVTEIGNAVSGSSMTTLPSGDLVIEGQYGTLTIRSDGFYTYELDNSNPDVNALKDGVDLQEVFTYTLADGDGDFDIADLTITINGRTDGSPSITPDDGNGAIDGHNTVHESGLVGGSTEGDGSNSVDGTIQISADDGLDSITIAGQAFDQAALQALNSTPSAGRHPGGSRGTLVLTDFTVTSSSVGGVPTSGSLAYTYTLTGGRTHSGSEDQSLLLDIPLSVTDAGNGTANGTLAIQVVDDIPQASVGGVPTAGTLTYTYTLSGERTHSGAGNDDVQLNIPLSVTDAGNATANGSLTIEVIDDVPTAVADTASVGEGATLSVDAASGVLSNDVAGADGWADSGAVVGVVAGDTGTTSSGGVGGRIDGNYGYLTLNADGSYVYVSTANAITGDEVEVFTYTVRDGDGDLSSTTLSINVADVTLSPVNESDSVNESGLSGGSSEGDGSHSTTSQVTVPSGLEVVPGSGTTTHGTFTIDEDGNYTYTLTETTSGDATSDSFTYVTRDANGNTVRMAHRLWQ